VVSFRKVPPLPREKEKGGDSKEKEKRLIENEKLEG
jgi:hypothetical protein